MSSQPLSNLSDDEDYQLITPQKTRQAPLPTNIQPIDQGEGTASFIYELPADGQSNEPDFDAFTVKPEEASWWSREQQEALLESSIVTQTLPGSVGKNENSIHDFEKRKAISSILEHSESGKPLIYKRIIWPGSGDPVTPESTVSFHLTAYTEFEPIPFDCTVIRKKPFLVRLDNSALLEGVYLALLSMKVGEKAEFIVVPELAYGKQGAPPRIPADSEVLFVINVKKVHLEGSLANYLTLTLEEQAALPIDEVLSVVESEKKSGNSYFSKGKFTEALSRYSRAIKFLSDCQYPDGERGKDLDKILSKLLTNSAVSCLQLQNYKDCVNFSKKALDVNASNEKALYLGGTGYLRMGKLKEARSFLDRAYKIKPSRDIIQMSAEVTKQEIADDEKSKQLAKLMARALNLPPRQ